MRFRLILFAASLVAFIAAASIAAGVQPRSIKLAPIPYSDPTSGAKMYDDYCAVCHGVRGDGNGPAAPLLDPPPPPLRTLALRNGGVYPAGRVASILRDGMDHRTHDRVTMPKWRRLFLQSHYRDMHRRIANLTDYVRSLQIGPETITPGSN